MKNILLVSSLLLFVVISAPAQAFWINTYNTSRTYSFGMSDNGNVFALTKDTVLYRSTMNGSNGSWVEITNYPHVNSYTLCVSGNTIYMSNSYMNGGGMGIYVSTDFGQTWNLRNNGLGADTSVLYSFALANGNVIAAAATLTPGQYKLYKTTNDGNSWNFVQTINDYV